MQPDLPQHSGFWCASVRFSPEQEHSNSTAGDGDTVSLFVFGEEESALAAEAEKHNGVVPHERVAHHHFPIETLVSQKQEAEAVS